MREASRTIYTHIECQVVKLYDRKVSPKYEISYISWWPFSFYNPSTPIG